MLETVEERDSLCCHRDGETDDSRCVWNAATMGTAVVLGTRWEWSKEGVLPFLHVNGAWLNRIARLLHSSAMMVGVTLAFTDHGSDDSLSASEFAYAALTVLCAH